MLTDREQEILRLLEQGLSDREIADALVLSVGTVKWYNREIYSKLGARNRTEAVNEAYRLHLLGAAPSVPSEPSANYSLPAQITSFVGRERELAQIAQLLRQSRLITLSGPPGTGKTRLALEAARTVAGAFRDGACFVSLAPLQEPGMVARAIAQALDVKEAGSNPAPVALQNALRDRDLLLVLDNFEHLLAAAPLVSDLLAAAPDLHVLVTSRETLRLYGETEYPIPPLELPTHGPEASLEAMRANEAVRLFVQRAQAASPGFRLDESNASAVAMICVHLDGLPLALELAAARVKFYAPPSLLLRLSSRLEALSLGPRDLPARQQTLRATLAWSYDLLDAGEQALFARLGIFAGGWTLDDAAAVCDLGLGVADGLESLVNKNLLRQERAAEGEPRFMMLETMREYALEKLAQRGELATIGTAHADHFARMAEIAAPAFYTSDERLWMSRLEAQHDNLRAALRWYLAAGEAETCLRLGGNLARFWRMRGYLSEGREWLEKALELDGAAGATAARARALQGAGGITYIQSDYRATRTFFEEALPIFQALGDQTNSAHMLIGLGEVDTEIGNYESALPLLEQACGLMRQSGDVLGYATAVTQLGWAAMRIGDYERARACLNEGLPLFEQLHDRVSASLVYSGLGEIAVRTGEYAEATQLLEQSLSVRRAMADRWGAAASLGSLAWVALRQQDFGRARALLSESISLRKSIGERGGIAWCMEKLAEIAALEHQLAEATRLLGAAAAIRASVQSIVDPTDQPAYDALIDRLRAGVGDDAFTVAWAAGYRLPLDEAIQMALRAGD
ncbi:MAG: tetratricopeptide repeat protein [Anaerolineae bacterium]|nr:tetratricopeptide repeat protein [Anaerolineae bacterium]